ncbi:MAG: hypothetical protein ACRDMJ_08030 [Solirubrobacteraceae bacterium]
MMAENCGALVGIGGRLSSSSLERSPDLLSPGALVRTAARIGRLDLDRRLARGEDPAGSVRLAARAAHLACPLTRRRLARALERLALAGAGPPLAPLGPGPLRGAIAPNRDTILELAARLRQTGVLYARGIATLELILIDGAGPAYTDPRGEGLARQLEIAAEELAG